MKFVLTFFALLFLTTHVFSQNITGIWRGYFYADVGPFKEYYKYEVQIDELANNSLKGVTYSYRTTIFYGKALFEGIWFPKTQSLLLKETKLVDLKMAESSQACAMTCDLQYLKNGKDEIMKGTFTSVNTSNNSDCGSGTVYLERVAESDFKKEDFLLNKKPLVPKKDTTALIVKPKAPAVNNVSKANTKKLQSALGVPADGIAGPKTIAALNKKLPGYNGKPDFNNTNQINNLISQIKKNNAATVAKKSSPKNPVVQNKPLPQPHDIKSDTVVKNLPPKTNIVITPPAQKLIPVPDVLKKRSNNLFKTIVTNSQDIKIELFDNGFIDGDTITVYHNNQVIAWKKGLSDKPITINLKADPVNEFVMVADNLGSVPPNTALMVITTGGKRYEVNISSDNNKNAKVVIDYNPSEQ